MKQTLAFLSDLKSHNDRDWFQANKSDYQRSDDEIKAFSQSVFDLLSKHDELESKPKIFRIYRDVRFAKDKSPYKTNRSGSYTRATAARRGGYYWSIEPGNSFLAGGFWGPDAKDMLHIRKQISQEPERLEHIIQSKAFTDVFGELKGEKLKTAPKGFQKDDPALPLLQFKQFLIEKHFTDEEVTDPTFPEKVIETYLAMHPFFDYMSEILTTDLNGASILP